MTHPYPKSRPSLISSFVITLTLIMMTGFMANTALAESVRLAWNPSPAGDLVAYKLYYGFGTGAFDGTGLSQGDSPITIASGSIQDPQTPSTTLSGLAAGETYDFAVTAVNQSGVESAFSNVLAHTTASLPANYAILSQSGPNGVISPAGTVSVLAGESQTYTMTPNAGYHIDDVTVDGASVGPLTAYTFSNVGADHTIAVQFAIDTFTLTATATGEGTISPADTRTVACGDSVTYTMTPAAGYHIADVTVDGISVGAVSSHTLENVTGDHAIAARFEKDTVTHSATAQGQGQISPSGAVSAEYGASTLFTMTPDAGYRIADVTVDGVSVGAVSTHTLKDVTRAHTVVARFEADPVAFRMEAGQVTVDQDWQRVAFTKEFTRPVVIAKSLSANDAAPTVVRIDRVDATGFEISLQEWDYLDGIHPKETVGYLVVEAGRHTLADGTGIEAGYLDTDQTVGFATVPFSTSFQVSPVVIAAVTTFNEYDAVTVRLENISRNGFSLMLQEEEANTLGHAPETVAYIAWEPSRGTLDDHTFEIGMTDQRVTHTYSKLTFAKAFDTPPSLVADMQTCAGINTANVRWRSLTAGGFDVKVAEEASHDKEINHIAETIGYMAFTREAAPDVNDDKSFGYSLIPQSGMRIVYADSEELVGTHKPATNAIDGQPGTLWHTEWYHADPDFPHEIIIDLGMAYEVGGLQYLPRQDGIDNGTIAGYSISVSLDGDTWDASVNEGIFAADKRLKEVGFAGKKGRYIKFVALSEINGGPWASAAEINILGKELVDRDEDGLLNQEETDIYGTDPDLADTDGDGLADGEELAFWKNNWNIDLDGDGLLNLLDADADGDTLTDGAELAAGTNPADAMDPAPVYTVIPQTQQRVVYTDSEELVGTYKPAGNVIDGRNDTVWHTEWFNSDPEFPHEVIIDLGMVYEVGGVEYLPRQDGNENGTIQGYAVYVGMDSATWGAPVAQGNFAANTNLKKVKFPGKTGQYLRFVALSEINGKPWASAAEIRTLSVGR